MGQRIWHVEERADIAALVSQNLKRYGYAVQLIPNCKGLTDQVRRYQPDLVVSDIDLDPILANLT